MSIKQGLLTNDLDSQLGSVVGTCGHVFNLAQREHPVYHFAKHDVFAVQEITLGGGDEELYTSEWGLTTSELCVYLASISVCP
jgi:hypothetical protein